MPVVAGGTVRLSPSPQAGVSRGVLHRDGQDGGGDDAAADDGVQGESHGAAAVRLDSDAFNDLFVTTPSV